MDNFNRYIKDLYPAMINTIGPKQYGYIDSNGRFIIPAKFSSAENFNEDNIAIVCENEHCGVIDSSGNYVIPPLYDSIEPFTEKRAVYMLDNTMGVITEEGKRITKKPYNFIASFSDSLALVGLTTSSGEYLYGYIDRDGREIILPMYIEGSDFKDNIALVKDKDGIYKIINKAGMVMTSFPYKHVGNYGEGVFTFSKTLGGLLGYVDTKRRILIEPKFTSASKVEDGYMIVSTSPDYPNKYGVINITGDTMFPFIYDDIKYLGNNRFALGISRGDNAGFMNNIYSLGDGHGNSLTPFKFLSIERYEDNLASAYDLKHTYFIDLNGKPPTYSPKISGSGTLKIQKNLIYANIDYIPFYINENGAIVYKPNDIIPLNNDYSVAQYKYKPNINYLVYYPQVFGISYSEIQNLINYKLLRLSNLKVIDGNKVLDYEVYGSFEILFYKKDLFIPEINTYTYPFGAAHGLTTRSTPNINLLNGEFYTLADLFKNNINWQEEIDKIIKNMINTDPQYDYVYENGFKGIKSNQDFYVDSHNLYIYFTPYEIAPYFAGFVTFKIPFITIDSMINKRGNFYKSFNYFQTTLREY